MATKSLSLVALAGVLFLGLAAALVWFITQLVRGNQNSVVTTIPVKAEQELQMNAAGTFVVLLEAPQLSTGARNFQIDLTEKQTGQRTTLKVHYLGPRTKISGMSTAKIPYGQFTVSQAGSWAVYVSGFEPNKDYSNHRLVISRPYAGRMVFQIVGIVICGVGMLLSIIGACWAMGLLGPSSPRT